MSDNRAIVYTEGGQTYYRASGFGRCDKALTLARMGIAPADPPKRLAEAFKAGHAAEDRILDTYEQHHGVTLKRQGKLEREILPNVWLRGTYDGLARGITGDSVVDAKYLGTRYFDQFLANGLIGMGSLGVKYATQGLIYCHLADASAFAIAAECKATGEYFDETYGIQALEEMAGITTQEIPARIEYIEKQAAKANYEVDSEFSSCGEEWGCPYYFLHSDNLSSLFITDDGVSEMDIAVLGELVLKYEAASEKEKIAKAEKDAARKAAAAKFTQMYGEEEKAKVRTPHGTISRYSTTRTKLDKRAIRQAGIDLEDYTTRTTSTTIRITPNKDNDE